MSVPTVISAGDLTTVNLILLYCIQWFSVFTFVLSSLVCGSLDMQRLLTQTLGMLTWCPSLGNPPEAVPEKVFSCKRFIWEE